MFRFIVLLEGETLLQDCSSFPAKEIAEHLDFWRFLASTKLLDNVWRQMVLFRCIRVKETEADMQKKLWKSTFLCPSIT